jgi:hypothetical protein
MSFKYHQPFIALIFTYLPKSSTAPSEPDVLGLKKLELIEEL